MPATPANYVNELIMGLLQQKRMPMQASPELAQHLAQYRAGRQGSRLAPGNRAEQRPLDTTNVIDPAGRLTPEPPPISRDPWFDNEMAEAGFTPEDFSGHYDFKRPSSEGMPSTNDEAFRATLVGDMMRATGIEPHGLWDRYYSQLLEIDDAFVRRIGEKLGLATVTMSPNQLRGLIADEFEYYGRQ